MDSCFPQWAVLSRHFRFTVITFMQDQPAQFVLFSGHILYLAPWVAKCIIQIWDLPDKCKEGEKDVCKSIILVLDVGSGLGTGGRGGAGPLDQRSPWDTSIRSSEPEA